MELQGVAALRRLDTNTAAMPVGYIIQVGIRPDRRARGMLHISEGGSEWGVGESGRGRFERSPYLG